MNKYNAIDDDDESFPQVASCPGWLVGGISYLGPVLILFRLHSTPSNMSFIKDYSDGDEEEWSGHHLQSTKIMIRIIYMIGLVFILWLPTAAAHLFNLPMGD